MKMIINNLKSKISNKRAMKRMCKDLAEVYANTDYSDYEISVSYDAENKMLIIPKPVMALSFVDEELSDWISVHINNLPVESVLVA